MKHILYFIIILALAITDANAQIDTVAAKKTEPLKKVTNNKLNNINEKLKHTLGTNPGTEPEPSSIYGYVAWVDPVSGKKHVPLGRNTITGRWEYTLGYPTYTLWFGTHRIDFGNGGRFQSTVDSSGNQTSNHAKIVAYKYKFYFHQDLSLTGAPYSENNSSGATIYYNPDLWKFTNIEVRSWGVPIGLVVPITEFPDRPVRWSKRTAPFSDLPDF